MQPLSPLIHQLPPEILVHIAAYAKWIPLRKVDKRFKKVVDLWLSQLNKKIVKTFGFFNCAMFKPIEASRAHILELQHRLNMEKSPGKGLPLHEELCALLIKAQTTQAFQIMVGVTYNDYHRITSRALLEKNSDKLWGELKAEKITKVDLDSDKRLRLGIIPFVGSLNVLPLQIGEMTSLQTLVLSSCSISTIPESIGKLKQLTFLDLIGNRLKVLPREIGQMSCLQKLFLQHNKLKGLPSEISNLVELTVLNVSHNRLQALPWQIVHLAALTNLSVTANQNLQHIPFSIDALPKLKYFGIDYFQRHSWYGALDVPLPSKRIFVEW